MNDGKRDAGSRWYPYPFFIPIAKQLVPEEITLGNAGYRAAEEEKSGIPEITGCITGDPNRVHNPVQWLMEVTMDGSKDAE